MCTPDACTPDRSGVAGENSRERCTVVIHKEPGKGQLEKFSWNSQEEVHLYHLEVVP